MTKCNSAHPDVQSIEAMKHSISTLGDLFDVILSLCCVHYSDYCVPQSFRSNAFLFVSSFPAETLEKPVLPTGKCFATHFASLILCDQRLSNQFPKKNGFCLPNVVHYMVKVMESHSTRIAL